MAGAFANKPQSQSVKWLSRFFLFGILAYLTWLLERVGWTQIWAARPKSPTFYLLLLASYLALPVTDTLIYSRLWRIKFWRSLPAFLRKRIYNDAFVDYSGELFLMMWARRRLALADRTLAHIIKDINILSAAVSTLVSAALLIYVFGNLSSEALRTGQWIYWGTATIATAVVIQLVIIFRKKTLRFSPATSAAIFGAHLVRFTIIQLLQLALWRMQLPSAAFSSLIALLAVQMLVGRIPFLPSRDVLFVGIGIGLSGPLALPQASVAGLLVTTSLFQQIMHLGIFLMTSFGREAAPR